MPEAEQVVRDGGGDEDEQHQQELAGDADLRIDFVEPPQADFGLAVFGFSLSILDLDDVETERRLHHIADLTRLQRKRGLLKLSHHLATAKPTEVSAFVFAAVG